MKFSKTAVFLALLFLSFCSFSFGNVQAAENAGNLVSATAKASGQQKKPQVVQKIPLTPEQRAALIEETKLKSAQKKAQKAQNMQLSSTQKQNEFSTDFPFLAALNSKVLKELGTPLAFPKDFSSELWFRCNPVYGALLWRNKMIQNLLFALKKSLKLWNLHDLISMFFEEIGDHEVIINKDCPKDNWGCVAGHLILYEQGKITDFDKLSKKIDQNCGRQYDSNTLEALFNQKDLKIKHFLPSLISAFVYAASKQFSTPKAAAEYLQRYRNEFKNAIKGSYKTELISYKSLVDDELNDSHEEMKFFKESFHLLCKSFVDSQVPTEQEFIKDLTFKYADNKQVTWSNCNEAAFTNWFLGTAYNPENHKFEPEKVTLNKEISNLMRQTNGFDSLFNQSAFSGALQILPFVIYRQIKIGEDKFTYHLRRYNEGVVLVPHEFYEKLEFEEKFLHNETSNPNDPKNIEQNSKYFCKDGTSKDRSLGGKYDGSIYFIDQSAYPDAFSFDLDSSPMNFLILCYYLGFPSLRQKFQSVQEIFEIAMKPTDEIYKVLQDSVSNYDFKLSRKTNYLLLQFPFGFYVIPSGHSFFGFKEKSIALKTSELLEKDNLLRIILSGEDNFEDQFEKLIWALVKKKIPKNLEINYYLTRMSFDMFFNKISFPDIENFMVNLIIKDPTFLNGIQKGSIGELIFSKIEKYFDDQDTIFSRLTKEISDRSILLKLMEALFDRYNADFAEEFYHSSTRNQGLLKAYGGLFFTSGRNPRKAREFVLNDLANNYKSFERDALINMILEICSHTAMKYFESILDYVKIILAAIKSKDEKLIEKYKKDLADAKKNDETIQILEKLPFLTKEYLKGYSFSFKTPDEQSKSENYKIKVSPSFYAAFALKYDLSFEFIKEIKDEPFNYKFKRCFEDLEIGQDKWNQLKENYGNLNSSKGWKAS